MSERGLELPERVQEALKSLVVGLNETYSQVEAYLFGSHARETWLEESDVDIIVISPDFKGRNVIERMAEVRRLAPPDIPFEIITYTPEEFEEAKERSIVIGDAMEYWIALM